MRNIGEAFSFPFKDPDWVSKFLKGGAFIFLSFFIIGIPVVFGYDTELVQRVRRGDQHPLPEWNEPGVKFILGIKYLTVLFIYHIPLIFIIFPTWILIIITSLHGVHITSIVSTAAVVFGVFTVVIPYVLFINLLTPIISAKFAERERIADAVQVGTILHLFKTHWRDCLAATLISVVTGIFAAVGIIFFIIGILFTTFYASLIRFHLYGQIAQCIKQSPDYNTP